MDRLADVRLAGGSFGVLLRARRHRAYLAIAAHPVPIHASPGHPGCLFLVSICHQHDGLAARAVVRGITFDHLAPAG